MPDGKSSALKPVASAWKVAWRCGGVPERLFLLGILVTFTGATVLYPLPSVFLESYPPGTLPFVVGIFVLASLTWCLLWLRALESAPILHAIAESGLARGPAHLEYLLRKARYLDTYGWRGRHPIDLVAGVAALAEAIVLPCLLVVLPMAGLPLDANLRVNIGAALILPLLGLYPLGALVSKRLAEKRGFPVRELARGLRAERAHLRPASKD